MDEETKSARDVTRRGERLPDVRYLVGRMGKTVAAETPAGCRHGDVFRLEDRLAVVDVPAESVPAAQIVDELNPEVPGGVLDGQGRVWDSGAVVGRCAASKANAPAGWPVVWSDDDRRFELTALEDEAIDGVLAEDLLAGAVSCTVALNASVDPGCRRSREDGTLHDQSEIGPTLGAGESRDSSGEDDPAEHAAGEREGLMSLTKPELLAQAAAAGVAVASGATKSEIVDALLASE